MSVPEDRSNDEAEPTLFSNRFTGAIPSAQTSSERPHCDCMDPDADHRPAELSFHADQQDTTCAAWRHLLALIEEAATDGRDTFKPFTQLSRDERRQIVTLPDTIATLTQVRHLVLYGTHLVRIPAAIGAMSALEVFEPYTSHRLHWYPYELARCTRLRDSTVSTRVLYGNYKLRSPFPQLQPITTRGDADFTALDPGNWGATTVATCSVCDRPLQNELHQAWISLRLGTDVLPLLVNACSHTCLEQLPSPPTGYFPGWHTGGPSVEQPTSL